MLTNGDTDLVLDQDRRSLDVDVPRQPERLDQVPRRPPRRRGPVVDPDHQPAAGDGLLVLEPAEDPDGQR